MTLLNGAWAIDGATLNSALARTQAYAANSGAEGIVQLGDLKVSALATAGAGVRISEGAGLVLNRYQIGPNGLNDISQSYTVLNPDEHVIPPEEMPASSTSVRHFILAITVGDPAPEFSQSGHLWMTAGQPAPGSEATFRYVRPFFVPVALGATQLPDTLRTPALALARIEIPANTTTITSGMIIDLRKLARPRTRLEVAHTPGPGGVANPLNGSGGTPGAYERWPNVGVITVDIPPWAVKAKVIGFVEGVILTKAGWANLRVAIDGTSLVSSITDINENAPGNSTDRRSYNVAGEIDVRSVAGTTRTFSTQATPVNTASKGALSTDSHTSVALTIYFEEVPT